MAGQDAPLLAGSAGCRVEASHAATASHSGETPLIAAPGIRTDDDGAAGDARTASAAAAGADLYDDARVSLVAAYAAESAGEPSPA